MRLFISELYWYSSYGSILFVGVFISIYWYHLEVLDVIYGTLEDRGFKLVVSGNMLGDFEYYLLFLLIIMSYHLCTIYLVYMISFSVAYPNEYPFSLFLFIVTPWLTLFLASEFTMITVSNNLGILPSSLDGLPQLEDYLLEFIYIYVCSKIYLVPYYFRFWKSYGGKIYSRFSITRALLIGSGSGKVFIISLCISILIYVLIFFLDNLPSGSSRVSGRVVDCA